MHNNKYPIKVDAVDVTLTPTARDEINLAELNAELETIALAEEAKRPNLANAEDGTSVETDRELANAEAMANNPQQDVDNKEEQLQIARNLLQQAELIQEDAEKMKQRMLDEAKQKVQQAYEIAPELKSKKGKGRSKDSQFLKVNPNYKEAEPKNHPCSSVTETKIILMADDNDADFLDIINSVFPSIYTKTIPEKVDIHMNDGEGNTFVQTLEENKMPNEFPVDIVC